jgi:hypothetical protein
MLSGRKGDGGGSRNAAFGKAVLIIVSVPVTDSVFTSFTLYVNKLFWD